MKKGNKFLLLFAIFTLTGSMASVTAQPSTILGKYVGELSAKSTLFGLDETFYDITMKLEESTPNYSIEVEELDLGGGIVLPPYKLDNVVITQNGNKYILTKTGALNIVIPEIVTPLGTFTNVPVAITLESGSVENNILTLDIKAVATVTIVIPIPVTINVGFEGALFIPDCDPVINANAQIENCEKANITWTAVNGAKEYEIKRDGNLLGTVITPTFTETAAFEDGKSYTWTIKTICNQNQASEVSVSATADCAVCNHVTGAEAHIDDCKGVTITWNAVAGAKEYKIVGEGGEMIVKDTEIAITGEFVNGETYTWTIVTICESGESDAIEVEATADCVGISELDNNVSVYPNPANTVITIDAQGFIKVEVYNTIGQLIETKNDKTVDVSAYNTGIYFLHIQTENGTVTKKVMKN